MDTSELSVVTGAFGYTGRHIAARLLALGNRVRTLVSHFGRPNPFGRPLEIAPLDFTRPDALTEALRGATTLYNTYWIRFPYGDLTFERATENSRVLLVAAAQAGVRRIVHISVSNPSLDSPLPYFRGKALVERTLAECGIPHAIVRPTLVFGAGDILINNIAWMLRRFPVFALPGSGDCLLQPVSAEDVAAIAVAGSGGTGNVVINAMGPDTLTFGELVRLIARSVGSRAWIVGLPPRMALALSGIVGRLVGDIVLTREEADGLLGNLLTVAGTPTGVERIGDWLRENADTIGHQYASELRRHYRQHTP